MLTDHVIEAARCISTLSEVLALSLARVSVECAREYVTQFRILDESIFPPSSASAPPFRAAELRTYLPRACVRHYSNSRAPRCARVYKSSFQASSVYRYAFGRREETAAGNTIPFHPANLGQLLASWMPGWL